MRDLKEKILENPSIAAVFASGLEIYLVGGYLRDILRGASSSDVDFLFRGDARELFSRLSSQIDGKVIEFRKGPLLRVISERGTFDFTELKGELEEDLYSRDFTMNAAAWCPQKGIIDPVGGIRAIEERIIKAVSRKNLMSDPLRLLRAYRFVAELGWRIDSGTRTLISKLRSHIKEAARERITLELFKMLDSENPLKALSAARRDGLLTSVLACDDNRLHNNIKVFSHFGRFLYKIHDKYNFNLGKTFSQGLSYRGLLRAEILLFGADIALSHLSLSRAILKRINEVEKLMASFFVTRAASPEDLFDLFESAGHSLPDFAIVSQKKRVINEAIRFLSLKPLLPTIEIMRLSDLEEGPKVGVLLRQLKKNQFIGRIRGVDEARSWLRMGGA